MPDTIYTAADFSAATSGRAGVSPGGAAFGVSGTVAYDEQFQESGELNNQTPSTFQCPNPGVGDWDMFATFRVSNHTGGAVNHYGRVAVCNGPGATAILGHHAISDLAIGTTLTEYAFPLMVSLTGAEVIDVRLMRHFNALPVSAQVELSQIRFVPRGGQVAPATTEGVCGRITGSLASGQVKDWQWTATATGRVAVTTVGSSFDTILTVLQAGAVVATNDDSVRFAPQSSLAFDAVAGTTYTFRVQGKAGASGTYFLNYGPPAVYGFSAAKDANVNPGGSATVSRTGTGDLDTVSDTQQVATATAAAATFRPWTATERTRLVKGKAQVSATGPAGDKWQHTVTINGVAVATVEYVHDGALALKTIALGDFTVVAGDLVGYKVWRKAGEATGAGVVRNVIYEGEDTIACGILEGGPLPDCGETNPCDPCSSSPAASFGCNVGPGLDPTCDPIPDGMLDALYWRRVYIFVDDWTPWSDADRAKVAWFKLEGQEANEAAWVGIELMRGKVLGTLGGSAALPAGKSVCVETSIAVSALDGKVTQQLFVEGVAAGSGNSGATLYPGAQPVAACRGFTGSQNLGLGAFLEADQWRVTDRIGCAVDPGTDPGDGSGGGGGTGDPTGEDGGPSGGDSGRITVAITNPVAGAILSNSPITLRATASYAGDSSISELVFLLDGKEIGRATTADPYTYVWAFAGVAPGRYTLTAKATSSGGASTTSAPVSIVIADVDPPAITFSAPPAGTVTGIVEAAVTASDNVAVAGVQFYLDGQRLGSEVLAAPWRVVLDTTALTVGAHTLTAVARDVAGNVATASRGFTVGTQPAAPISDPGTIRAFAPVAVLEIDLVSDAVNPPYRVVARASAPYVWYRLLETAVGAAADASGNARGGTLAGPWTFNRPSALSGEVSDKAARLDNFATGSLSFPALVRPRELTLALLVRPTSLPGEATLLDTGLGGLRVVLRANGSLAVTGLTESLPSMLPLNIWSHVALVLDAGTDVGIVTDPGEPAASSYCALYVDGQVVALRAPLPDEAMTLLARTQARWKIGGGSGAAELDELAVYDFALSPAEIARQAASVTAAVASAGVWTDISGYSPIEIPYGRGRENELDQPEVRRTRLALEDEAGDWEPENTASRLYPLQTMRRVRLRANVASVMTTLEEWFTEDTQLAFRTLAEEVQIPLADASLLLARATMSGKVPRELTGAFVNRALDAAGWPEDKRAIDAGRLELAARTLREANVLDEIHTAAGAELGVFFVSAGVAVFHDRDHRQTATRSIVPQIVFGDSPSLGEYPYEQPEPTTGIAKVYNDVRFKREGGIEQTAIDIASQRMAGRRVFPSNIAAPLASDRAVQQLASSVLERYRRARFGWTSIVVDPTMHPDLWDLVLKLEVSDRIMVVRRPRPGTTIRKACFVEQIAPSPRFGHGVDWPVVLTLSDVGVPASVLPAYSFTDAPSGAPLLAGTAPNTLTHTDALAGAPLLAGSVVEIYTAPPFFSDAPSGAPLLAGSVVESYTAVDEMSGAPLLAGSVVESYSTDPEGESSSPGEASPGLFTPGE